MTFQTAENIFQDIKKAGNKDLLKMFLDSAIKYAQMRTSWAMAAREERIEMDERRTRAHNAFIDMCNIMARGMAKDGEDNTWRQQLGNDRKEIGDLACYIHCMLGISAR